MPLPKMNERSTHSIRMDRARVSKQKWEIKYKRKNKKGKKVESNKVQYRKKNGSMGYKVRKINKKTGKKYWKYL